MQCINSFKIQFKRNNVRPRLCNREKKSYIRILKYRKQISDNEERNIIHHIVAWTFPGSFHYYFY